MKMSGAKLPLPGAWLPLCALPLVALLLILPLLLAGPSCGHDFGFHMQSWMDASEQMRHGVLLPHWAYSPAFNAGEPRFVFYPPLSWVVGSLLLSALPAAIVPALFSFVALLLAGYGMYALARRFAAPGGALLAAAIYLANPYMLFTAFERTAYAELLAAAWMPWLLRAALAENPSVLAVAVPLALLWLTNAPAAVMGTYAFVLVVALRSGWRGWALGRERLPARLRLRRLLPLWGNASAGLVLGLSLAAFYLVPAAWERRYVQIAMAIIPNMRVEDNFLFGHTGYAPHDRVLHTASLVALGLFAFTLGALLAATVLSRKWPRESGETGPARERLAALFVLAVAIGLMLLHITLPLWRLLPELAFLQFPWRLLAVLGCVFGTAVASALGRWRVPLATSIVTALLLATVSGFLQIRPFRQGCEAHELPADRVALFAAHHGVGPTDEYTPTDADNDQLRWHDPAWWLAHDANAPGPGTVPNPAATIVDYDAMPPLDQTVSGRAPTDLHLQLPAPENLILNLRAYPAWAVTVNHRPAQSLQRDDGLLAIALPAGVSDVDVRWRRLPDVLLGDGVSLCALAVAAWLLVRSRRIEP